MEVFAASIPALGAPELAVQADGPSAQFLPQNPSCVKFTSNFSVFMVARRAQTEPRFDSLRRKHWKPDTMVARE
jgi:hypothetical protein